MKIRHTKRQLNINLIYGFLWLIFFITMLFKAEVNWIDYGWGLLSLMYFINYFYLKKYKYLAIENGMINVNGPLGKKLSLNEVKRIKKFGGDYILKTDKKELTICTQFIETDTLNKLNKKLEKLGVVWC